MRKSTLSTIVSLCLLATFSASALTLKFKPEHSKAAMLKAIEESHSAQHITVDFSDCANADDDCVAAALEKFNKSLTTLLCAGCEHIKFHFTKESPDDGVSYAPLYTFPNDVSKIDLSGTSLDWEGFLNLIAITKKVDTLNLTNCDLSGILPEEDELSEELIESTSLKVNSTLHNPFEQTEVRKLLLSNVQFCENGLETLLNHLSGLTEFEAQGLELDGTDFDAISTLKGLKTINLEGCAGLTTDTLSCITGLGQLKELYLSKTGLSLDQIGSSTFPYVDKLSLKIGAAGWFLSRPAGESLIQAFPSLTTLIVESDEENSFKDEDLLTFNKLKKLVSLNLSNCTQITAKGMITFLKDRTADKSCHRITSLTLSNQEGLGHATILDLVDQAKGLETFTVDRAFVRRTTGESLKTKYPNLKLILTTQTTNEERRPLYEGCIK